MTGYYKIATCDRCGFEKRIPKDDPDDLLRLPNGWQGIVTPKKWDLCPICKSIYNEMMFDFIGRRNDEHDTKRD